MCRLLDIPTPTSDSKSNHCQAKIVFKSEIQTFIYQSIRDSQANNVNTSMLEGAFEGLEHEAASAAFEDLAPGLVISTVHVGQAFFDRFQKTQGRKNSRLKKTQGCFSAKNSTFRRFLRLQPKNSKEKIVHRKIFIWVDTLNVIFMDMFVDFCNIYALLCAC